MECRPIPMSLETPIMHDDGYFDDRVAASVDREDALSNAPRREGDFVRVRAVLE